MKYIHDNLKILKKKIQMLIDGSSNSSKTVQIVVVTKKQKTHLIKELIALGMTDFGENYIQEGISKIHKLKKHKNIVWHFIGKVQSKKTKLISENFHWCQTVDREKIAFLLNKNRPTNLSPMNVLMQINISRETNKNGVSIEEYLKLAKTISMMPNLIFRGVMSMPQIKNNILDNHDQYVKINTIFNVLKQKYESVDTLSLGTSIDISESLLAESNMLRIGQDIFNRKNIFT
ncbi:YggS family pyridoxal phosphate-dependent enzyme [Buchnera aphidicola (Hyadaphis tataricae)]|uniref:Pyridoxal phosphate homeostasis protein n=1 Tax=Buchnera aphidicola (Hyadaphis tataricae) TaxID=1241859 RepID=A0A4D6XVH1_9GAMM|nr:YggS family pyridoxal phosphate-dependent enzyme [Buchnera aphidicola]QCI21822.1 YggS family pyridoxal phosphate-dependent enzyme [Buchnera aphidicola (Hyadaphis tataricae)]